MTSCGNQTISSLRSQVCSIVFNEVSFSLQIQSVSDILFPLPLQYSLLSQRNPVSMMISELGNGLHPELSVFQHGTVEFSCTSRDWIDVSFILGFTQLAYVEMWVPTNNNTLSILDARITIIWV